MPERVQAYEQNVRRRVLWPLGITLVIFLILFLTIFQIYLQRQLTHSLNDHVTSVNNIYQHLLDDRSRTMQSLINLIQNDKDLQKAMIQQDRKKLFALANPVFLELFEAQGTTHFYFHNPDKINFLRVHKPDRYGDLIDRLTMKQAHSGIQLTSGAEMGPLGTFTLRVVAPWFTDNKLIGFIELGEEIEPLLSKLSDQTMSKMAILIRKDVLKQEMWAIGQEMLGRASNWDFLPDHVITASTDKSYINTIPQFVSGPYLSGQKTVKISSFQGQFRGKYLPLIDTSGVQVGVMLVMLNAEAAVSDHGISTALVTIFCISLGGVLFFSAHTILGRTEQSLNSARNKLIDEIEKTHQANIQLGLEIGEKKAAEQALKEAHDDLETRVVERTAQLDQQKKLMENLVSNIPSYVAWKNLERSYIGCNSGYAGLAGCREDEIAGKNDADLEWSASFRLMLATIDEEVLSENRRVFGRELHDKSSDKESHYLCSAVPLHNENGEPFGMVSILQNITEQKEKQKLLEQTLTVARQSSDRISGVMRSVDDALFVVDADDNILLMNESAGALLRLNPDEVIGKNAAQAIWLEALRDKVMEILRKREAGVQFDFEIGNDEKGAPLVMQSRSSILIDPLGRYEGMIFLARDVTRDRSMDRLKSDFISVAAHELRTPLATILGFSELLLDDNIPTDEDRQDFTRAIYEKTDSLSRLLDDMLDISRIESGRGLELFIEKVQADDLFMPIIKQYQKRELNRQFNVELENSELLLEADPDKIAQVLENLLSNAVKYSEQGSLISIAGKVKVEGYRLTISDEGIGMTPEQVSHAFDKFYRGDTADKAIKGTGIGLTIVKHIIDEHNGTVWIDSRPGNGTDIHFILPIA